jgi:hypothetical protein
MRRTVLPVALLVCLAVPPIAAAQAGEGSLRGVVQDDQGAALPPASYLLPPTSYRAAASSLGPIDTPGAGA